MKRLLIITTACFALTLFSGCFIFKKKDKYGCPVPAKNTGAENASLDKKEKKRDRYRGGSKF